jgi:hypothetical protein
MSNQNQTANLPTEDAPQIKALNVLTNGIRLAQSRGAFSLSESSLLFDAMKTFMVDPNLEPNGLIPKPNEEEVKSV